MLFLNENVQYWSNPEYVQCKLWSNQSKTLYVHLGIFSIFERRPYKLLILCTIPKKITAP